LDTRLALCAGLTTALPWGPTDRDLATGRVTMPRLSFEEPKGGPLAKAQRQRAQRRPDDDEPTQLLAELLSDPAESRAESTAGSLAGSLDGPLDGSPEERPGRHRRSAGRDTVLVVLKGATVALVIALIGAIILLTTASEDTPSATSPTVPDIPESHRAPARPPTSLGAILAPQVGSTMTEIVRTTTSSAPPPVPTVPPAGSSAPGSRFVRVGDKCDTRGAYAFTESFEPVVCDARRGDRELVWRAMFR
jgi:hypothetical protein